ncbi:uracil-DNA glycosylase family protein [Rhodopirellula bahusiensis]|uniref:Single-stranded DNA-binding protein n=1 Tax=Rhodopirellula bahusiensis TaxID=2014065 RepID=A0A2G1W2D6_9BACT|nr:single-stranded DNA-binding protein [Rhodopirellula bahusiensis]PHQ32839.1 single-stranded DNA-binding protein [Rhodopirellula bahusiensis]
MPSAKNPSSKKIQKQLLDAASELADGVDQLQFDEPVTHVYNPLRYAWGLHEQYVRQIGANAHVLFLGMNPGPWGMAQTGVPFGEINSVVQWMGLKGEVERPDNEHPKRPVEGLNCSRSEVSGRRLWGLVAEKYPNPSKFFENYFVANYCPLVFMEAGGKNRTPDKLLADEREALQAICDVHLKKVIAAAQWTDLVGVGAFAENCLKRVVKSMEQDADSATAKKSASKTSAAKASPAIHRILHPSPASPAANKDWAGKVTRQLMDAHIW